MGGKLSFDRCLCFIVREKSDRTPLLLDTWDVVRTGPIFRFENSWFLRDGPDKIVTGVWNDPNITGSNIKRWQKKLRLLRPKLKGWNRNMNTWYRELKKDILLKLDKIDKHYEKYGLSIEDRVEQIMEAKS